MLAAEILAHHVRDVYAVARRWLGEDSFEYVLSLFIQDLPEECGLEASLQGFSDFFRKKDFLARFPLMADVVFLEWLCYNSGRQKSAKTCFKNWMSFSEVEIPSLCFQPHPSLMFFSSPYDLKRVFTTKKNRRAFIPEVLQKSSWAFVIHVKEAVEVHWLGALEYLFLESLAEGASLQDCCRRVTPLDPNFDIAASLKLAFLCSLFQSVYTEYSTGFDEAHEAVSAELTAP